MGTCLKILGYQIHMAFLRRQNIALLGDHLSVHHDLPAVRRQHSRDHTKQRGFSAPGSAHDPHDLAFFDFHADSA